MAITLRSFNGSELVLSSEEAKAVAKQSLKICQMIKSGEKQAEFPVGERVLKKAIEYCFEHGEDKKYYVRFTPFHGRPRKLFS